MQLVATALDGANIAHFQHDSKYYWVALGRHQDAETDTEKRNETKKEKTIIEKRVQL